MLYDERTKPFDQWTYYVVDHLPSMANIYRYDTVEEAIEKYKSLPEDQISAIGSSIFHTHELDLIQRRGGKSVLVMDYRLVEDDRWRYSTEIQDAIDRMIAELSVDHEMSSLFSGNGYPSFIVELSRYRWHHPDHYFDDKLLLPDDPKDLLTSIQEVYVEGEGWLKRRDFLKLLEDSRPGSNTEGLKPVFADRFNIHYVDMRGRQGQADISPTHFRAVLNRTEKALSPEALSEELYAFSASVDPYEARDQADIQASELEKMKRDIASGSLFPYIQQVSLQLSEGLASEEDRQKAVSLLVRLNILSPREFRKPSLARQIGQAESAPKPKKQDVPSKHKGQGIGH